MLFGDHEQLRAIGAGAPFRAIAEQVGHAELSDIRRQRVDWQREASVAFATLPTGEGPAAYRDNGHIRFSETCDETRAEIVRESRIATGAQGAAGWRWRIGAPMFGPSTIRFD